MTIDELRDQVGRQWKRVSRIHDSLMLAHKLCDNLEKRYKSERKEHERLDRELSLLDGRYERLLAARIAAGMEDKPKGPKQPRGIKDLTRAEIIRIAKEVGLELPEVEEEEDQDELLPK